MASNLKFKRTTTDKLQVKGILSEDCTTVEYEDENGTERQVKVTDLLKPFMNQPIDLSASLKSEEDLDLVSAEDK